MRAIQITEFGGPEVLTLAELPDPVPPEGLTLIDVDTAGVNYADTHQAEDSYLAPQQPAARPGRRGRRAATPTAGGSSRCSPAAGTPRRPWPTRA